MSRSRRHGERLRSADGGPTVKHAHLDERAKAGGVGRNARPHPPLADRTGMRRCALAGPCMLIVLLSGCGAVHAEAVAFQRPRTAHVVIATWASLPGKTSRQ
jgi:hypothetical protein